jgi:hypothetical protein
MGDLSKPPKPPWRWGDNKPKQPIQEFRPQAKDHYANRGRADLFDLPANTLFIVVGLNSGVYETNRQDVIRFALKDVEVFEYERNLVFSLDPELNQCTLVARADHTNCIRKAEGMAYANLKEDEQTVWLGRREDYVSRRAGDTERVSLKLFRDLDIRKELRIIQKRLINYANQRDFIEIDDREVRLHKSSSMLDRLSDIIANDSYHFVPWLSPEEVQRRIEHYYSVVHQELTTIEE